MSAIALRRSLAALFVVATAGFLSACGINTIPTYDEQAKASWSEVLNQYQRRADLIPNLRRITNPEAFQKFQQEIGRAHV